VTLRTLSKHGGGLLAASICENNVNRVTVLNDRVNIGQHALAQPGDERNARTRFTLEAGVSLAYPAS